MNFFTSNCLKYRNSSIFTFKNNEKIECKNLDKYDIKA